MRKIFRKKNIKYYLIFYLLIELKNKFTYSKFLIGYIKAFFQLAIETSNLETFIKFFLLLTVVLILFFLMFVIETLPVTIFLFATKAANIEIERKNKKYTSREKIIYYRDKLNKVSPTTISLMQNLKVEEEKDLTATIMKLQLNKNIAIENGVINILSDDESNLLPNEKQVFNMLSKEKMNKHELEIWKNIAIDEAREQGFLKEKSSAFNIKIKKFLLIILLILFFLGLKYFLNTFLSFEDEIKNANIPEEVSSIDEFVKLEDFDTIFYVSMHAIAVVFCFVGIISWPIFYIIYISKLKKNSLKRTIKGEYLTDVILGMKRFIHDFSLLSESDKQDIILWDDFLIYAIVLEENEKIVDEILDLKKVKRIDKTLIAGK